MARPDADTMTTPPAAGQRASSAVDLAGALTSTFLQVLVPGEPRPVSAVEILEPGSDVQVEPGDLVLGIGVATPEQAREVVARSAGAAGLVLRREVATSVREECVAAGLTLAVLAERASWSALAQVVRAGLEHDTVSEDATGYQDLFTLADSLSALLRSPVTIEDERSRVLAWSSDQPDVDGARTATIIGRRVPREVRDRYRAKGVFRHLASSDAPLLVPGEPAGRGGGGIKSRWVMPVRAGGEWLGSVWAVLDGDAPPPRADEAQLLADVLALHLLRLRARSDLHGQVALEHVRSVLRGTADRAPDWLARWSGSVVVLAGPAGGGGTPLSAAVRRQVWAALLSRQGWARPLVADLDGEVLALVEPGAGRPGRHQWLREVVEHEHARNPSMWATSSAPVADPSELAGAVEAAREQARLGVTALRAGFTTSDDCWAAVHLARVRDVPVGDLASPVRGLLAIPHEGATLVRTLTAVLRHWADPGAAARTVGVHPNTIRNRMAKIDSLVHLDLTDPTVRLACWLECERLDAIVG